MNSWVKFEVILCNSLINRRSNCLNGAELALDANRELNFDFFFLLLLRP